MQHVLGLTSQEFWASVIALCAVGLMFLMQDAARDDSAKNDAPWRWGDSYRRPKKPATWGNHGTCACVAAIIVSATLGVVLH